MDDNETFIVVIGEESDPTFPAPIQIKNEVLDEDEMVENVEEVLNKAKEFGELVDIDCPILKQEPESSDDNLNVTREFEYEFEDEYIPKSEEEQEYEEEVTIIEDIDEKTKGSKNNRRRMLKPSQRRSYIKELKNQFQELEDDEELLVKCLVEIMKSTKPPPPPMDYYVMNGIMFECIICGTHTESIPAAGRHYQEKHGERYLYCYACGANFRSTTNLYKHEKRCEASNISIVLKARALSLGRKGRSRPFLPTFHNREVEPRRFDCEECSATFSTKYSLQAHILLHQGLRPYRCPVCPCAYTSSTVLRRHVKKHSSAQYICDHCERSFNVKAALVAHLDTHLPQKKYGCSECPKRYAQKAALVLHERRVHLRLPPPAACRLCDNRYPRMSVLKEHMRKVHGMELMTRKMFLKKLPTLSETQLQRAKVILKEERHVKKHSSAQYICDHCERSFNVKAALVAHLDTHLPQKKYGCSECPKRYAQKAALVLHERRVHLRLPPPAACRLCDNRYPRMSVLKEHMRKVHGMELMTRKMFLKKLPTLSETQLQRAKVILKEEVQDNDYCISNQII